MTQPVAAFAGSYLYLDTMIFHLFLRVSGSKAEPLFRSIQQGHVQAYTSVLTFDELAYRMLLALIRDEYGGSPQDHLRQDERYVIATFYPRLAPRLRQLETFPNLTLLDLTAADLAAMHRNIRSFSLCPRDALHLAAMQKADCLHLVSHDADFDHIPDLHRYTLA